MLPSEVLAVLLIATVAAGPIAAEHCTTTAEEIMEHIGKLGPELKLTLEEVARGGEEAPIAVLAQVQQGLTDARRAELADIGAVLRSEAGDVVTMTLPVSAIASLAAFDWVVYVEASRPLSAEDEQAPPPSAFD
ncbi:MAG: hypothetical protein P8X53_14540 [Chromatiales bacterium]